MPFNKVKEYQHSLNILDSEIGLVTKTFQAEKELVKKADDNGRYILKAGTLFKDEETNVEGIVFEDYDLTDYKEYPISVVVAGRVLNDRISTEAQAKKEDFANQGLYVIGGEE